MQLTRLIDFSMMDEFFICGPEEMIFCIKEFLENNGIEKDKIHFELFTSPGKNKIKNENLLQQDNSNESNITIKLDGRSFTFKLEPNSNKILDAALAHGADLPFSCKGGVCTTCKAKLMEGEVEMEVNYGLEHDEVKTGFILTCQSHPRSEKVIIDFDVK